MGDQDDLRAIGSGHPLPRPPPKTGTKIPSQLMNDDRWLEIIGIPSRLAIYAALFGLLYAFAPKDIFHMTFAQLTPADLIATAIWFAIGIGLVRYLFKPSTNLEIRKLWGSAGCLLGLGRGLWT